MRPPRLRSICVGSIVVSMMSESWPTKRLDSTPDCIAPDGSEVRLLAALERCSMATFRLAPGQVSSPVAHHSVDEFWYVLERSGETWLHGRADGGA